MPEPTVRVLEERRFDPPRVVEVEHDGSWWPGTLRCWRLCDDSRGWMAEVAWTQFHDWGPGSYVTLVPPRRVRLLDDQEEPAHRCPPRNAQAGGSGTTCIVESTCPSRSADGESGKLGW